MNTTEPMLDQTETNKEAGLEESLNNNVETLQTLHDVLTSDSLQVGTTTTSFLVSKELDFGMPFSRSEPLIEPNAVEPENFEIVGGTATRVLILRVQGGDCLRRRDRKSVV